MQERFGRSAGGDVLADIYDGYEYRKLHSFLKHPTHVSLTLNTDGVAIYRSSKVSIWPVWFVINELPLSKP